MFKKIGIGFFLLNLILLDALAIYYFINQKYSTPITKNVAVDKTDENPILDTCGTECQKYISENIAKALAENSITPITTETPLRTKPVVSNSKTKNVSYLPIPGGGSTNSTVWTTLAGSDFYISKADYPGLTGVYFEANMKLANGNGTAFLRVYDVTHSIAPSGGEITTTSQSSAFVTSGNVYLWEGNNHYVVQVKSSASDTVVFESGKLKIITEN